MAENEDNLSVAEILKIQDYIFPPLYYATDENIEPDKLLFSKETKLTPEFVVFHPSRLDEMKANARSVNRRLVHIREAK